jgi:hypothetical protein
MALTDTEIKRTKKREKPYKLSDGGNMYLWITPQGGSCGDGPIGIRARKS